jgi:hypothetical protein
MSYEADGEDLPGIDPYNFDVPEDAIIQAGVFWNLNNLPKDTGDGCVNVRAVAAGIAMTQLILEHLGSESRTTMQVGVPNIDKFVLVLTEKNANNEVSTMLELVDDAQGYERTKAFLDN